MFGQDNGEKKFSSRTGVDPGATANAYNPSYTGVRLGG
jgi:hypothetical protein